VKHFSRGLLIPMGRFTCRVEHVDLVGGTPAGRMIDTADKSAFIASIFDCRFVEAMSF
jgi:hypothetical protein